MTERTEFDPAYGWKNVWTIDIAYPGKIVDDGINYNSLIDIETQTGRGVGTQVFISQRPSAIEYLVDTGETL